MNTSTDGGTSFARSGRNRLRRLFSCNPFYLASAGVLLYGLNQLSCAARFAGAEPAQITFNFAVLFVYEILLVWTAIVLAQRAIWSDALLLVALENLFVLVPFSLVSRAVQLDEALGKLLCLAAVALAGLKFWALRRYIPRLNLPPQLLGWGAVIMGVNIALALGLRHLSNEQPHAAKFWITAGWVYGMPLLIGLGNCLPRTDPAAQSPEQKAWLPYAALGLWLAVTASHLGGVGYVYSFHWQPALLAPSLWVLAWTVVLQTRPLNAAAGDSRRLLLFAPLGVTVLALGDTRICFVLNALNVLAFAWVWRRGRERLPWWLGVIALAACAAALPEEWRLRVAPGFSRPAWVTACALALAVCASIASRDPRWSIVGGGGCFLTAAQLMGRSELPFQWAAQAGLAFLVVHSLRWRDDPQTGGRPARIVFCVLWMAQSVGWSWQAGDEAMHGAGLAGAAVLVACGVQRCLSGRWPVTIVPASAAAVIAATPGWWLWEKLSSAPPGYLAVATSFLLFGCGTLAALTKHRWLNRRPD